MNSAEVLIKFKGDTSDVDKDVKSLDNSMGKLTKAVTLGNLAAKGISKGFEIMSQNLDGAISRVDTLNNFSNVMQNLGISAKDSQEVINNLSEKLQGLPTSLDSASSSVQRLTSYNGDIKKSEKIFLAMNNAILAGTNDAGMQASAMEQLTQAYTKGKPEMQDWKTLLQAMPAQLKQVAIALGYPQTDQLYNALQSGEVSMDTFMDTMVKLNDTGVKGFASFNDQARSNTDGIATSVQNMKTAFVRGVGAMITQVDGALKPFGGLSGVINKMGKAGEQAFKVIGGVLKDVIPMLIDVGKSIIPTISKVIKSLSPILQRIGSALLPAIISIIEKLLPAVAKIIDGILPILIVLLDAIEPLIEPLVQVISAMIDYLMAMINPLLQILQVILPPIISIISNLAKILLPLLTSWLKFLAGAITGTFGIVKGAIQGIKAFLDMVINFIKTNWQSILLFMINPFAGAIKFLYDKCEGFRNFVNNFVSAVVGFFKSIPGKIKSFATGIVDVFKSIPGKLLDIGKNIVKGLWNGIKGMKTWVLDKVKGFGKSILNGLKGILGIHSPSTEFALIGKFSVLGYTEALDKMKKDVDKTVQSTFGLNPELTSSMQNTINPNIQVYNNVNIEQDPLGQMVRTIKTYSGGSPNDYNYGAGV